MQLRHQLRQLHWLDILVYVFIGCYTLISIIVSLNRYWQFQAQYFDFGIFDRAIWLVAHFQAPLVDHPSFGGTQKWIWADHFHPSIFLLSPLYWLTDRREILLIAQSVIVGSSTIFAYLTARQLIKNSLLVVALLLCYLGYVGLQNAIITEFHDTTIATLPLMICLWAIIKRSWKTYFISLIILLACKESFAGTGLTMALLIYLLDRHHWRIALITFVLSLLWAFVTTKLIIPYFLGHNYYYTPQLLTNPVTVMFTPIIKSRTMFFSFASFGFLPLLGLPMLPMIFESFFERFLLPGSTRWDLTFHYNAVLSPMMLVASVIALHWLEKFPMIRRYFTALAIILILNISFLHYKLHGPLQLFTNTDFYIQNIRINYLDDALSHVPSSGLVMAQNDLALHLTHQNVILLRQNYEQYLPDTIIMNFTDGQNPNVYTPLTTPNAIILRDRLMNDPRYSHEILIPKVYLFEKKSGN